MFNTHKFFILLVFLLSLISCNEIKSEKKEKIISEPEVSEIIEEDYELYKPGKAIKAVLILFGGYPEDAKDIEREFKILDIAKNNDIAVILSNYNQTLWLEEKNKIQLAKRLQEIIKNNKLPTENIVIGGFSSGGNVSLLISNYLLGMKHSNIKPKGVFIVDSPIDLAALYYSSEKNIKRNFSEVSVQESKWIIETLENAFGNPNNDITNYEENSVFTSRSKYISNLNNLKNTKIRLYTEPDTIWWKENRKADYDQLNSYYIKRLETQLKQSGFDHVALISTENKGYRANGDRHPHSWTIVDKIELVQWILE